MSAPAPWSDVRQWHRPLLLVAAVTAPFTTSAGWARVPADPRS